tara:strand:+ start:415 stop:531 length:117 start_codon:yes stop_codon:yes gene_type:complete
MRMSKDLKAARRLFRAIDKIIFGYPEKIRKKRKRKKSK